jgi:hypothetical protein
MRSLRTFALCLLVGSVWADLVHAAVPGAMCSIEEVEDKIKTLDGKTDRANTRAIMRQCNWQVDASSCTFRKVINMFVEKKSREEVRSECMR